MGRRRAWIGADAEGADNELEALQDEVAGLREKVSHLLEKWAPGSK
jgi:hypothetical protein